MSWTLRASIAVVLFFVVAASHAVQPDEILADSKLEARARELSRELRCMVCQNQSIDDSDAPLARDLRILVRERLVAGDDDRQVLEFLTIRYGEFVLLKPRWGWGTAILWFTPAAVLLIGGIWLAAILRRRRYDGSAVAEPGLNELERARLTQILDGESASGRQITKV